MSPSKEPARLRWRRPSGGRLDRAVRRAVPALGIGLMLLLLAIPAVQDLGRLFIGTGLIAIGLAVVIGLYTWFDQPARSVRDRGTD